MKKVTAYTLSTCPWCRKTKQFFAERQIPFTFIDYDLSDETTQQEILREVDAAGRIDDEVIAGYQPERYALALGLSGGIQ